MKGDNTKMTEGLDDNNEFYLDLMKDLVEDQKKMLGEQVALQKARGTPLEMDKDGDITGYYGKGEDVLETILRKYGEVWGDAVARRKMRKTVSKNISEENYEQLPDYMRPKDDQKGMIGSIIQQIRGE
ncbi:MAG: hypothetical protein BRC30_00060 [Nanohaloarchaea archaeon SW_7_46_7]|nr:MAG: hypothetical protein BRC30_00060 [Nanohaloarchaea archaeon SW_7_46_7]